MIAGRCKSTRNTTDNHRKIHDLDFGPEYLKEVWDKQNGICPITGWKLKLKTYKCRKTSLVPQHASVDRIDNDKGYIKGNIRFISVMCNYALNKQFTDQQLLELASAIYVNTYT